MIDDVYDRTFSKALAAAEAHLPNPGDPLEHEAAERYARAAADEALAARAWEQAGRPFTLVHSNGTEGAHPAYRAAVEAARQADRALRAVPRGARRRGPRTTGDAIAANVSERGPKFRPFEPRS